MPKCLEKSALGLSPNYQHGFIFSEIQLFENEEVLPAVSFLELHSILVRDYFLKKQLPRHTCELSQPCGL